MHKEVRWHSLIVSHELVTVHACVNCAHTWASYSHLSIIAHHHNYSSSADPHKVSPHNHTRLWCLCLLSAWSLNQIQTITLFFLMLTLLANVVMCMTSLCWHIALLLVTRGFFLNKLYNRFVTTGANLKPWHWYICEKFGIQQLDNYVLQQDFCCCARIRFILT